MTGLKARSFTTGILKKIEAPGTDTDCALSNIWMFV